MTKMLSNIWKIKFASELCGDLWDMLWHHHWCIINYLDPSTIIFRKTYRPNKMQNNCTVMLRYSINSKVLLGADLCNFPLIHFQVFLIFPET